MSDLEVEPYYEAAVEQINDVNLFEDDEIRSFSKEKTLYDFQVNAIKNALKLLNYWGEKVQNSDEHQAKRQLFELLKDESGSKIDTYKLHLQQKYIGGETFSKLEERYSVNERSRYGNEYREVDFYNFVNQMGFWMATGSGKTLVIIKLMELTQRLMERGIIPERELLLLVPGAEIREQFEEEIEEYNTTGEYTINIHDAEDVNNSIQSTFTTSLGKTIDLYVKRADLISDETKETEISFEDIENGGNWYVFLDEAHKGESDSSKRQAYYSILARNGFLFNASATFTDTPDIATTVYNYNIEKFNADGYGKNIFVADESLQSITDAQFDEDTKRKTVLESLIALTAQKKAAKETHHEYHNPLLTAFVHTVNTAGSDLEMFFEVVEEIGKRETPELFKEARGSVISMITSDTAEFEFGSDEFDWRSIKDIQKEDVLQEVYNASSHSALEVKYSPDNKKEIGFKLKSSSKPFALIRIGDTTKWLSQKLDDKSIEESYDSRSYFDAINDSDSPINLLIGSRKFYEGWDSNRPNVMLFIGLGRSNKKKLIMQAVGRGMRIEPEKGIRRRADYAGLAVDNKEAISTIESLIIFATSVDNLEEILDSFKWIREQDHYQELEGIERNETTNDLYVPVYEESGLIDLEDLSNFEGDIEVIKTYLNSLSDEMLLFHLNTNQSTLNRMKKFVENDREKFIGTKENYNPSPIKQLKNLKRHISRKKQKVEDFRDASEDNDVIVHFDKIQVKKDFDGVTEDVIEEIENAIQDDSYETRHIEIGSEHIDIDNISEHYYSPVLYSEETSKAFKNIIDVASEYDFLQSILQAGGIMFEEAEWWYFSAVEEHLDNVYIPYSGDKKFKPDFIFWIKHNGKYKIVFIDPKSISMSDEQKIEGYKQAFEDKNGNKLTLSLIGSNDEIEVYLYFYNRNLPEESNVQYPKYWAGRLKELENYVL